MQYPSWRVTRSLPSSTASLHPAARQSAPSSTFDRRDEWAGRLLWGHTTYQDGLLHLVQHDSSSQNQLKRNV